MRDTFGDTPDTPLYRVSVRHPSTKCCVPSRVLPVHIAKRSPACGALSQQLQFGFGFDTVDDPSPLARFRERTGYNGAHQQ